MSGSRKIIYGLDQIDVVAQQLAHELENISVMTFAGSLGAGKTTLIKQLLKSSGVDDLITSPTFNYMNMYKNKQGRTFYHFDLYRITSIDSFIEAGFNEYLYVPNSVALIEWAEVIDELLTHSVCHVTIDYIDDLDKRELTLVCK